MKLLPPPTHSIQVHNDKHSYAATWCYNTLGPRWEIINKNGVWAAFWCGPNNRDQYVFKFHNKEDAVEFALRWA